tara:strand:+ start:792 stop:929 length:138 start_codon:yes stop_codon:yes gene_type:complete
MSKELTEKQEKAMLRNRYGDFKEKPEDRKSTEKELMENEQAWEED